MRITRNGRRRAEGPAAPKLAQRAKAGGRRFSSGALILLPMLVAVLSGSSAGTAATEYRVLATNKTSTMQKEMQLAADAGFRFSGAMGGETSFGGAEVVVVMSRPAAGAKARYEYRLLATAKTSTMQKELQESGDAGFQYAGQTVFKSMFGGNEVVVILERDRDAPKPQRAEYKLLATKRTATMQKELQEAAERGFEYVGVTVGQTLIGGTEVVCILKRPGR